MSQNSSKQTSEQHTHIRRRWLMALLLPLWLAIGLFTAQLIIILVIWILKVIHVPLTLMNETVLSTILAGLVYVITLAIVIGLPWVAKKRRVSREVIGLQRLPSWIDIGLAPAGLVVYFILSAILIFLATTFLPWFDVAQVQDTGFSQISLRYEYILAFVTLIIIAPIAEEILFRGYLFGKLLKYVPVWIAILITSALFAAIHGAWNLALDTFALSIILCLLRLITGSLWASILLHMIKNSIAFYFLFINPTLLNTLGG